jgi:hypothetical protein
LSGGPLSLQDTVKAAADVKKPGVVPSNKPTAPVVKETGTKATPIPMPTSKAELKKDKYYNTPRGVAKWDGSKFTTE